MFENYLCCYNFVYSTNIFLYYRVTSVGDHPYFVGCYCINVFKWYRRLLKINLLHPLKRFYNLDVN